ncbi:hypothetical protein [Pseudomonas sp. VB3]|uniref:hypothetical protein n=1 Tax=Pseudomonas sp. VB3 TaxID=2994641 RepID=UPI0022EC17AC|nr:hypothetical protein [Pseudomonas sp. VB3]
MQTWARGQKVGRWTGKTTISATRLKIADGPHRPSKTVTGDQFALSFAAGLKKLLPSGLKSPASQRQECTPGEILDGATMSYLLRRAKSGKSAERVAFYSAALKVLA